MKESIIIDSRLKKNIKEMMHYNNDCCSVKFKDLDDTFWFDNKYLLNNFLNNQASERYFDRSLRKGYFDYTNEYDETFRYYIEANRGTLKMLRDEEFIN